MKPRPLTLMLSRKTVDGLSASNTWINTLIVETPSMELESLRQMIMELNPPKAAVLQRQNRLEPMLWEYQEQINQASAQAAGEARRDLLTRDREAGQNPQKMSQWMQQASQQAKEMELAQIKEEIQLLFGKRTTESPTEASQ